MCLHPHRSFHVQLVAVWVDVHFHQLEVGLKVRRQNVVFERADVLRHKLERYRFNDRLEVLVYNDQALVQRAHDYEAVQQLVAHQAAVFYALDKCIVNLVCLQIVRYEVVLLRKREQFCLSKAQMRKLSLAWVAVLDHHKRSELVSVQFKDLDSIVV